MFQSIVVFVNRLIPLLTGILHQNAKATDSLDFPALTQERMIRHSRLLQFQTS